jgi:hypothetical protein
MFTLASKAQLSGKPLYAVISTDSLRNIPIRLLPANYYSNHLGFFCKKEIQVEKVTGIPFRFRLGSIDYTNYLEQKPNAEALKKP